MVKQNKKRKGKIIKLVGWVNDFGIPRLVEKKFTYFSWDELLKEAEYCKAE